MTHTLLHRFTELELKVWQLMSEGYFRKTIAAKLGHSANRIARIQKSIYRKLRLRSGCTATKAIVVGLKLGVIKGPSLEQPYDQLTKVESTTLRYAARGHGNKRIALIRVVSVNTTTKQMTYVCKKLKARNRTQAVAIGIKLGIIT